MSKSPKKGFGPEFSREREFKVLLEDLQSSFRAFGEGMDDVREQLNAVKQNLASFREEFTGFRIETRQEFSNLRKDLHTYDKRLSALESTR